MASALISQDSLKNLVKSKGIPLLFLGTVVTYIAYRIWWSEILLKVSPYLPHGSDKSKAFNLDLLNLIFGEGLWLGAFLLVAWIFASYIPLFQITDRMENSLIKSSRSSVIIMIVISFLVSVVVSYYTLEQFPNSSDEYAYLFQAETLSKGKLWEKAHDLPEFFRLIHIAEKDGIRVGRFPPGWPLILSTAFYLGIPPFLVNPFLGLLSLVVFYSFAKKFYGERIALWSLLILAFTSFFIFNAASYFSHTSCMLATISFVYSIHLYREKQKFIYPVAAGFFLGIILIIRYYTAVLIFLPFFFYLIRQFKVNAIIVFFWMGLGALPCLLFLFWYNYTITGSPLLPVTMWAYADEGLGFVRGHTPAKGMEHLLRWACMFLYWCSPALLILYGTYLWRKLKVKAARVVHPEDYMFILLVIGYFFYYEIGGNQYGPRFFFEAFPFLILFVVREITMSRERWATALLCAGIIYAFVKIPFIAQREHQVVEERNDIYRVVERSQISHAVVLISTHTGVIRPMPAGDLVRNDVGYGNDVLFAHDIPKKNSVLRNYFPDRTFYRYVRDPEKVEGWLVKVEE
jgi:hypothetical protein